MIEKPDMDKAVFCRVVKEPEDGGEITLRLTNLASLNHVLIVVMKTSSWKKEIYS